MSKTKIGNIADNFIIFGLYIFAISCAWSISLAQIGFSAAAFGWILKSIAEKRIIFKSNPVNIPLLVLIFATILSSLLSVDILNSLKGSAKTISLMFLYFLIVSNLSEEKHLKTIMLLFVISCIGESIFGQMQYFGIIKYKAWLADYRISGSVSHPIFLGEILMMGLCAAVPVTLNRIYGKKSNFFIGIGISIMFFTLILTQSRGAWVGFFAGIITLGFMQKKRILIFFVMFLLIIGLMKIGYPESQFVQRALSIFNLKHESNKERVAMYKSGLLIMKDNPIGIGVHNVHKFYPKYKQPEAVHENEDHLHSNIFQIGAERGVLGLLAFLGFIFVFLKESFKWMAKNIENNNLRQAIVLSGIAGFIGFMISGLTEYNYGTSIVVQIMWFITGLTVAVFNKQSDKSL